MGASVFGIAWYREQDYARLRAMFEDGGDLPETFDGWLQSVQSLCVVLSGNGHTVVKAYIDPETFPAWCEAKHMPMNADARMHYGTECAMRLYGPARR